MASEPNSPLDADTGSADAFARIDLISNNTLFHDFEEADSFRQLLRDGILPARFFSSFIHEATHHWCFISPLGTSLSMLYLGVAKRALAWAMSGDETDTAAAFDDLLAFQLAVAWLRPLNEGLAQFAEYDVLPAKNSPLVSPPLLAALTHMFPAIREIDTRYGLDLTLRQIDREIMRHRLSAEVVDRKAELLLQPVGAHKSPYLLGYLSVKQLWRHAQRFYPELGEADVFLMFLRKFVFSDYALVATLLDRDRPGTQRALDFGRQLFERFHAIRLMPFDDDVPWSQWESLLQADSEDSDAPWLAGADKSLFCAVDTQEAVNLGIERRGQLFRELLEPFAEKKDMNDMVYDMFYTVMRERFLLWLGELPASWHSTGKKKGDVMVGEECVFSMALEHASDEHLDRLALNFYIDLYGHYQLTTVAGDRGVFGFRSKSYGIGPADDLTELKLDRQQILRQTDQIHSYVEIFLRGSNYAAQVEKFWDSGAKELLGESYFGFAFDHDEEFQAAITESGLDRLLDYDIDAIRAISAASLGESAAMTLDMVQAASGAGLDLRQIQGRLAKNWPFKKFPVFDLGDVGRIRTRL